MIEINQNLMIYPTEIEVNIDNNKLHQGDYQRFKIKLNIKKNLKNMIIIMIKINNSQTTNIRIVFFKIHIENLLINN